MTLNCLYESKIMSFVGLQYFKIKYTSDFEHGNN